MSLYWKSIVFYQIVCAILAAYGEDLPKCSYGDSSCVKNFANQMLLERSQGLNDLGLADVGSLSVPTGDIHFQGQQNGLADVNLHLSKSVYTFYNAYVEDVSGFGENLEGPHMLKLKSDKNSLLADYEVTGKVLHLPVSGSGKYNLTYDKPEFTLTLYGEPEEREDGKLYLRVRDVEVDFVANGMHLSAENLSNDEYSSEELNNLINAHSKLLLAEMKNSIEEVFSEIFKNALTGLFQKKPYAELFVDGEKA